MREPTLIELKQEKLRRLTQEKSRYYVPNGRCEDFIRQFGNMPVTKKMIGAFIAGNGTGKTAMLCMIAAQLAYPEIRNPWFDYPLFRQFPYQEKKIRIASDPTTIKGTIIPEIKKWFPAGRWTTKPMAKSYDYFIITDTGWQIEFMTYDQSIKEFESASVSIILLDEPPPYAIYTACIARLRMGGHIGIFFTPLTGAAWAYDEFDAKSASELDADSKFLVNATIEDNCKLHGVRGIIEHDMIIKIFDNIPEDEKEARAKGKFMALQGLIIKQYNPRVHIIKPFDLNLQEYCFVELLDPHPQMPDALLYVAIDRYNKAFIAEEIYRHMELDDLVATIKRCREGKRIIASLADPSAFNEDQHLKYENSRQKYSLARYLSDRGIQFEKASKARHEGIRRTQTAFSYIIEGDKYVKQPDVHIFENCVRTQFEISHWQWEQWKGSTRLERNPKGTPVDKDDHMMENIGRFFLGEFEFIPMPADYYADKWSPLYSQPSTDVSSNVTRIYD